jgi:integrase
MFRYSTESAKKFFGKRLITEITPEDVRQYRIYEYERGLRLVSVNHRQKNLRRLFFWLEEIGVFKGDNPASGRRVPLENERPYRRRRFLSQEEFQRLLGVADPKIRLIAMTAGYTGLRHGELQGIRKKDVDLDKCLIFIPKSKNGEPGYVHVIETLFAARVPIVCFLPDADSPVLDFTNFDKLWKKAKIDAGLKDFHLHDLRHTFASHTIMGSKDTYAVQHLLRLKTPGLMQRYAHLMQSHLRQAALSLDKQLPAVTLSLADQKSEHSAKQPVQT